MLSNTETLKRLDEMMLLGQREAYFAALKRIVEKLKTAAPDVPGDLPVPPDPSIAAFETRLNASDLASLQRYAPLLLPAIEAHLVQSGDPDGAPAIHMRRFREELISFHKQEIDRLSRELDRLKKGSSPYA